MKLLIILLLISILYSVSSAKELESISKENNWNLERINFYFENDIFLKTDSQYTAGFKISTIYYIPNIKEINYLEFLDENKMTFITLGITEQIFTPDDINESKLLVDDRPYAGWLYLELALHQSTEKELDSFVLQFGIVGKYSGAEFIQKTMHKMLNNETPNGWDNQLHNELGINLIYQHKWRFEPDKFLGMDSNVIPFIGASLGNVETDINTGVLIRYGLNPMKDFGSSSINVGGENGVPIRNNCLCPKYEKWSFTLNLALSTQVVVHNIFLDGNTFEDSHSVEKNHYVAYSSYGFNIRYKHFSFNYTLTSHSRMYKTEKRRNDYGSLLFSYLY